MVSASRTAYNGPLVNEPETITGTFTDGPDDDNVSDHATFTATRTVDQVAYKLTDAPLVTDVLTDTQVTVADITIGGVPHVAPQAVEFKVSMPTFVTVTVDGVTDFANHGEYVTAMGGGKIAAQACAGMPLVSKQGK